MNELLVELAYKVEELSDDVFERLLSRLESNFRLRGIEVVATHSTEERIRFLSLQLALMSIEGGGIEAIRAALGGDDGDLEEFARALEQTEAIRAAQPYHIRIAMTPDGQAPPEYRQLWEGIELNAIRSTTSDGDYDLITGESVPDRGAVYIVSGRQAIAELAKRSPTAAQWFAQRLLPDEPFLSFSEREVEATPLFEPVPL